jgi:hypothetical protein
MKLFRLSTLMLIIAVNAVAFEQAPNTGHAPSVTVAYKTEGRHSDILVSELRPTVSATYTYYNALGWTGGYTGLQMTDKGPGFIFSIWDPPGTESASAIRSIYSLPGSVVDRFGGEGTGVHYLDTNAKWSLNHWYRFVVRCWGAGPVTYFSLWTQDEETSLWSHHVTLEAPESSFRFDSWLYSFLEDWSGTGGVERRVEYRWPKVHTLSNQWFSITQADAYVAPSSLAKNPSAKAFDMGMNTDASIFVQTGGDTKTSFPGTSMHLIATGKSAPSTSAPDTTPIAIEQLKAHRTKDKLEMQWFVAQTVTPQFSYKVEALRSADDHGEPLALQQYIAPDAHSATLDLPANTPATLFVRLTLTDLFDRPVSITAPVTK